MVLLFAWRYFRSKKSTQAIQIISWVSVGAMAIGTAALIIVLSVFNGFEGFIKGLYSTFYPQLKIIPVSGKSFIAREQFMTDLRGIHGIKAAAKDAMEEALTKVLTPKQSIDILSEIHLEKQRGNPYIICFVGVNGVGKSTTLAKVRALPACLPHTRPPPPSH